MDPARQELFVFWVCCQQINKLKDGRRTQRLFDGMEGPEIFLETAGRGH